MSGTTFIARRIAAAMLALAIATVGSIVATADSADAADAAPIDIRVSSDGVNFVPTLGKSFFDGLGLIVPGDRLTANLWVKNPSSSIASMRLSARDIMIPTVDFAQAVTMTTLDSSTGKSISQSLNDLTSCGVIIHSTTVPADSVIKLSMTFTMAENIDGTFAQAQSADMNVVVAMRELQGGAFATDGCGDSDLAPGTAGGRLSFTGGSFPGELAVIGALLLGFGFYFVAARRRREETKES